MIWAPVAAFTILNQFFSIGIFILLKFVTSEALIDGCVTARKLKGMSGVFSSAANSGSDP